MARVVPGFRGAVIAYVVGTFTIAFLWHLVAFAQVYDSLAIYRDKLSIPMGLATILIQGWVFAFLLPSVLKGRAFWPNAIRLGLTAGILSWTFTTLATAAKFPMTSIPTFLLIETGFTLVQFAAVGPLMVLAYHRGQKN